MAEASSYPSRQRFSSDLRRIREKRGLTLEALQEETKIPLSVLQDFEETGLFDNPMFNRVYLRSLVRTYASFVEIPSKTVLEGLDEALLDNYKGRLAIEFLGEKPQEDEEQPSAEAMETDAPPAAPAEAEPSETEAPDVKTPKAKTTSAASTKPKKPKPASSKTTSSKKTPAKAKSSKTTASQAKTKKPVAEKSPEKPVATPSPEPEKEATPAKTTPPLLTTASPWEARSPGSRKRPVDLTKRASYLQWVLIVGAVVVFTGAIWGVIALIDRPDEAGQQVVVVDTSATDTMAVVPPRPKVTVGDTLDFVVVAAQKVERLHVRRDEDARRPYWIEEGRAYAYPALDRIVLESKVDRIQLLVEGYVYPTDRVDDEGRLVITRDSVLAFVDTITTLPVRLPAPPDTIRLLPIR